MSRWGSLIGSIFAVLITCAVLYAYGGDLRSVDPTNTDLLLSVAISALLYASVIGLGSKLWRLLLIAFGGNPARWAAERHLLISQIGKYIPGNFAQYVGRAGMAINAGIPPKTVGAALVTEAAATVAGGIVTIAILAAFDPGLLSTLVRVLPEGHLTWVALAVAAIFVLIFAAGIASKLLDRLAAIPDVRVAPLALAILLYVIPFPLMGFSLHLIVAALTTSAVPWNLSIALFAGAWIAGIATPGAPGGLGVRESLLTLGLAPFVGGASALSIALLHRGVSILGDIVALTAGLLLPNSVKVRGPDAA